MLYQLRRAFGAQPAAKKAAQQPPDSGPNNALPPPSPWPTYARVAGIGLLTVVLWQCSARHRRAFRALNKFMRQHPDMTFVFLSTLPCLDPTINALRRLGSWLMRRQLADLPNRCWLNAHRLLRPDPDLFADPLHLNYRSHVSLAHGLAAITLSRDSSLLGTEPVALTRHASMLQVA